MVLKQSFEAQLNLLEQELVHMASLTQVALHDSMKAVFERRDDLADLVIAGDDVIDECDLNIENRCMSLLVLQQPLARDLRIVGSISKIITDLERIGDHAVDIAKLAKTLNAMPPFEFNTHICRMLSTVDDMLNRCIEAFVHRDLELVELMCAMDDEVDARYRYVHEQILFSMENDPSFIRQGVCILSILRYLERIADHATNIGERTAYIETGELVEFNK